jgi:hypothetical protein
VTIADDGACQRDARRSVAAVRGDRRERNDGDDAAHARRGAVALTISEAAGGVIAAFVDATVRPRRPS